MVQFICPNCHTQLNSKDTCSACNWKLNTVSGIPVYLSEKDSESPVFSKYRENYDHISDVDLAASIQNPIYLATQIEKMHSYLPKESVRSKNVLEVGVGQGLLLKKILSDGPQSYTAIDISLSYLRNLERSPLVSPIIANAENIPFNEQFDLFIATDILEHVLNVGDFQISMNRALKMGGIAAVRVPLNENLQGYAKQNQCPYDYVHLRTFNRELLGETMRQAGFEPIAFYEDGFTRGRLKKQAFFNTFIQEKVSDYLLKKYESDAHINSISNHLGKLVMTPAEITVIARKVDSIGTTV